ncbi:hypothetical protein NIES4075_73100 [Tolypothrix sp. NIES-4075]|nr:hypothetical protein NIES4075_73100 [Tolypothrix sp. NIES-4075]
MTLFFSLHSPSKNIFFLTLALNSELKFLICFLFPLPSSLFLVIAWEAVKGILVSRITGNTPYSDNPVTEPDSRIPDKKSEIPDSVSKIPDCESEIPEEKSKIPDCEPPKPSTVNQSSNSPDLDQSLDQLLPNSLSQTQREDFIEFGKKKASSLPKPPVLPIKWIKKHHE